MSRNIKGGGLSKRKGRKNPGRSQRTTPEAKDLKDKKQRQMKIMSIIFAIGGTAALIWLLFS